MGWKELSEDMLVLDGSPKTLLIIHNGIAFTIDPGQGDGRAKQIHRKIDTIGTSARFALLTHGHVDHIAECKGFDRVFAHRWEVGIAENETIRNVLEFNTLSTKGFRFIAGDSITVTDALRWGDEIVGIRAVDTHGHTPGHTAFVFGDVAYVGDSLFGDRLVEKVKILYHTDVIAALKSLKTVEKLAREGKKIIPAHGPIVEGEEALNLAEKNRIALERMISDVEEALEVGGTLEEITIRIMEKHGLRVEPEFVLLDQTPIRSILSYLRETSKAKIEMGERGIVWKKANGKQI